MRILLTFLCIAFASTPAGAQGPSAAEAKLRDAVKQLTGRVQTAEAEAVTAKALQADAETKNKALAAQVEKLTKELAQERNAAEKSAAAAQAKLTERDADLARTKEALDKWKAGHAQVSELGRKAEAGRLAATAKATALEHRVADLTRKNLALYTLGNEVLARLEGFGYGTALAAREPFVGTMRVKLENEVQGYKDRLLDPKLKP